MTDQGIRAFSHHPFTVSHTDFISMYRFSSLKVLQNTNFCPLKLGEIQVLFWKAKAFPYTVLRHTDFFPKF